MAMKDFSVKHHKSITLTPDDGAPVTAVQIGKGRYTTAYRAGSRVLLITGDYSKELATRMSPNRHLPVVERIGQAGDRKVYETRYCKPLMAKEHPRAWADFKALRKARDEAWGQIMKQGDSHWRQAGHSVIIQTADNLDHAGATGSLAAAVREIYDVVTSWGSASWCIEVAKRNVGVCPRGHLVLFDLWFDLKDISP